jgi:hypothetical protein
MVNEARDPVTSWKAQNDHQLFIYLFIYDTNHGYFPTGYPIAFKLTKLA